MPTYIVVATRGHVSIGAKIETSCPKFYPLKDDTWLVKFDGTPRELSEALGIKDGVTGSGMIVRFSGYSGRAPKDVWDWIATHSDEKPE